MDKITFINRVIRNTLLHHDIAFKEDPESQNDQVIVFSFALGTDSFFPIKLLYDDSTDSILYLIRSNVNLKDVPEYDVLQWINEKNGSLAMGCFTHYLESHYIFLHYRINGNIFDRISGKTTEEGENEIEELIAITAFNLAVIMEQEENSIKKL